MYTDSLNKTWTVIVAEADREVRKAVAAALWRIGCVVAQAPDGPAVRTLLRTTERIDLLVIDPHLPGMPSAVDLTAEARAHHPAIAIVFVGDLGGLAAARAHSRFRGLVRLVKALQQK